MALSKVFTGVLLSVCFASTALAESKLVNVTKFALGKPVLSGTGCAKGTVGVSQTDDKKTFSLLFDEYAASAGESFDRDRDVKKCTMTIPIDVPKGFQIVKMNFDLRGFFSVPRKGKVHLNTAYDILDKNNKKIQKTLTLDKLVSGPSEGEYTRTASLNSANILSLCGEKLKLRVNTAIHAKTNTAGDDVFATLDSFDASAVNRGIELFAYKCK